MALMTSAQLRLPTTGRPQSRLVARAASEPQSQSRRAALTILTSVAAGLLVVKEAEAKLPSSPSSASQSGYGMEGPKKKHLSPDRRQEILAKVKPGGENKPGIETGNPLKQGKAGEQMLKGKGGL